MKSTFAAALLPLVASAANAENTKSAEYTYDIREFAAECNSYSVYCSYDFDGMSTSTNPDFSQGCSVLNTSQSGFLPSVEPTQCGTYVISVGRPEGDKKGPVVLTVYAKKDKLVGTYSISPDDLTTTKTEGGKTVQTYKGKKSITIEARKNPDSVPEPVSKHFTDPASTAPIPASPGSSAPGITVSSPPDASATATADAVSEPSKTAGTETSGSAAPSETPNGASRGSAFAGVSFVVSLMAFVL